jgi:hypothetical protein
LRLAEIAYLREEIRIRGDVPTIGAAIAADFADALAKAEGELAAEIARVKEGLRGLGFAELVDTPAYRTVLGSFGPQFPAPCDVLVGGWHPGIAELAARRQAILSSCPPPVHVNAAAIVQAEGKLRELIRPVDRAQAAADLIERSKAASLEMFAGMARAVDRHTHAQIGESVQADTRRPAPPTPARRLQRIGGEWSGGILN